MNQTFMDSISSGGSCIYILIKMNAIGFHLGIGENNLHEIISALISIFIYTYYMVQNL